MRALKSGPVLMGYCICTHFEPYISFIVAMMESKSHFSLSSWFTRKMTGFFSFSV